MRYSRRHLTSLMIVDLQWDFVKGGALAVPNSERVCDTIARIAADYGHIVGSLDWHPSNHISFESFLPQDIEEEAISRTIEKWPVHCVQWTHGAMPVPQASTFVERFFPKGQDRLLEEFSCVSQASDDRQSPILLYLRECGIEQVDVCGLALDYCVAATALALKSYGLTIRVLMEASAAVSHSTDDVLNMLQDAGVECV